MMEQFIISAVFMGSIFVGLAAARSVLGFVLHLMTLPGQSDRLAAPHRDTPTASL